MTRVRPPWFKRKPELYKLIQEQVNSVYPNLHFFTDKKTAYLRGSFPICHEGKIIDRYLVEVRFPSNFPRGIPVVREIDSRIPQTADRHVNKKGEACLSVPFQFLDLFPNDVAILDFLNVPVMSFFVSQSIFETTGKWPFGEWSHGEKGLYEFLGGVLKISNKTIIDRFLVIARKKEIKGHWDCPCGSQKRLRNCHLQEALKMYDYLQYAIERFA